MRILAVRGENLASLAAPFELDFCAQPLAGAGLFAITGETGAGKSTILDALCLGLYGAYPRISNAGGEKAPDPGGKDITGKDPRALLRRGAGRGFAEVDFLALDGQAYRVRWEVLRARGRANGALQKPHRSLIRIADQQPLAAGAQMVLEKVQELTDFTFDQFRRTVLLAQGEFDAFLVADENERAELLEKVTGTEIYAALSRRAYEEKETRAGELRRLDDKCAGIGLLDAGTRGALTEERIQLAAAAKAALAAIDVLNGRIEHQSRLAAAREKCAQAFSLHQAARAATEELAAERAYLADVDRAELLRPKRDALARAKDAAAEAQSILVATSGLAEKARDAARDAALAREAAQCLDLEAEERFKALGPLWTRCEQLDATIGHKAGESQKAEALRLAAEVESRAGTAEAQRIEALYGQTLASRDGAAARLAARPERAILADRAEEAEELLQKRRALKTRCEETRAAFDAAAEAAQDLTGRLADLASAADALRIDRDRLAGESEARRAALDAIGEDALRERDSALADFLAALREGAMILERRAQAQRDLVEAKEASATEMAAIETGKAQLSAGRADQAAHKAARAEITELIDLADATEAPHSLRLRASLIAGEPCPVCGGADHPHAERAGAGAAFVARIRARRAELDRLLALAASAVENAGGALAEAEARHSVALRRGERALSDFSEAAAAYAARFDDLESRRSALAFRAPLTAAPDAGPEPALRLAAIVAAARAELAAPLGRAKTLRADLEALRLRLAEAAADLERQSAEAAARRQALHESEVTRTAADMSLRELGDRLTSIDRELGPFLSAADLALAQIDRDPQAAIAQVRDLAETYRSSRADLTASEAALQSLEPMRAAAREAAGIAIRRFEAVGAEAASRAADLGAAEKERGGLLDGEPTGAHRTRHNEIRRAARASLERAREAETTAGQGLAAAANGEANAKAHLAAAERALIEAEAAFGAALASAEFTIARAAELLDVAREAREALRAKIEAIDKALAQAATSLSERQGDLADLLAQGDAEAEPDALREEVAALQEKLDAAQRRAGAIDNQLAADAAARGEAAALMLKIESARADLAIWQAVDEAIGSASGDKFRRFAQGITLDHLVALANRHLSALAPRYRLERAAASDLSIHVIDRDMGDERRATRSLSGGERFLASLSLAIALSGLEGRQAFVDTLFVDEGFGSLDAETLDLAIDALEALHGCGRKVGVVTHVAAMIERIAVQVRVEKLGNGRSRVKITQPGMAAPP
jgi:exonuclease SbcC